MKYSIWISYTKIYIGIGLVCSIVGCSSTPSISLGEKPTDDGSNIGDEIRLATLRNQALQEEVRLMEINLDRITNAFGAKIPTGLPEEAKTARNNAYPPALAKQDLDIEFRILNRRLNSIRAESTVYQNLLTTDRTK